VLQLQTLGVPARYITVGAKYVAQGGQWVPEEAAWLLGTRARFIGLVMFVLLGVAAFLWPARGSQWKLEEESRAEKPSHPMRLPLTTS
jgi:hypothetical protein